MTGADPPPAAIAVIRAAIDTTPAGTSTADQAEHIARELTDSGWHFATDEAQEDQQ